MTTLALDTPTRNRAPNIQYFAFVSNKSSDEYKALATQKTSSDVMNGILIDVTLFAHQPKSGEKIICANGFALMMCKKV